MPFLAENVLGTPWLWYCEMKFLKMLTLPWPVLVGGCDDITAVPAALVLRMGWTTLERVVGGGPPALFERSLPNSLCDW